MWGEDKEEQQADARNRAILMGGWGHALGGVGAGCRDEEILRAIEQVKGGGCHALHLSSGTDPLSCDAGELVQKFKFVQKMETERCTSSDGPREYQDPEVLSLSLSLSLSLYFLFLSSLSLSSSLPFSLSLEKVLHNIKPRAIMQGVFIQN